ncbi:L-histidine N(alpha)-methyltransferase [Hydrocarboniphaga effusa]|jgi:L-histidine N-alpha-methyltransferase|uniref:L-histidine N(alpha)-methyltransferase n=1 Tax=Hydrocarboniphaga effusa TaxID=243629 RepID=UPI003137991D
MARNPNTVAQDAGADAALIEIQAGLGKPQKALSPKWLYDEIGSQLFERICEQPEYYIPATERAMLEEHANALDAFCGTRCIVIEPGAGSAEKTAILLGALDQPAAYVPIEISPTALQACKRRIAHEFPNLAIMPLVGDFTAEVALPRIGNLQWRRRVLFLPGSTIGNFDPDTVRELLTMWKRMAGVHGGLIVGVDLRKPREILEAAYDDAAGVTAQFNLNLLRRLNREFGADFDLAAFRHRAVYNDALGRIEMHLVSLRQQRVHVGGESFDFANGETIHTENSYKYRPGDFAELALSAGWGRRDLWIDAQSRFSIHCLDAIR